MTDDEPLPLKAPPAKVDAAIAEAVETAPDAPLADKIEAADVALSVAAGQWRKTPAIRALGFASEIADQPPAFTLAAVAAVAGIAAGRPRLAEAGLRSLAALAVATAAKSTVKSAVVRTRPWMLLDHADYQTGLDGPDAGPWNSFPSGHTANAVAAARALARAWPEAGPALGLGAAAIAAIQVPRGRHHALDVVAGAVVGWAAESAVNAVAGGLQAGPSRRRPAR